MRREELLHTLDVRVVIIFRGVVLDVARCLEVIQILYCQGVIREKLLAQLIEIDGFKQRIRGGGLLVPLELQRLSEQAFDVPRSGFHLTLQVVDVEVNHLLHRQQDRVPVELSSKMRTLAIKGCNSCVATFPPPGFSWLLLGTTEILNVPVLVPEV